MRTRKRQRRPRNRIAHRASVASENSRHFAPIGGGPIGWGAVVEPGKQGREKAVESRHEEGRRWEARWRGSREGGAPTYRTARFREEGQNKATQGSAVIVPGCAKLRGREKPLFARLARGCARSPCKAGHLPNRVHKSARRRSARAADRKRKQRQAIFQIRPAAYSTKPCLSPMLCVPVRLAPSRRGLVQRRVHSLSVDRPLRLGSIGLVRGLSLW